MNRQTLFFLIFCSGVLASLLINWSYELYSRYAYQASDGKILKFDPYKYEKKSRLSIQYFYTSLPRIVQIAIQNKKMNFEYLTACEANLIPGQFSEFPISFFSGDSAYLYVFELESDFKVKNIHNLSDLLDIKKKSVDDDIEIQCPHSPAILNNSNFHLEKKESALAEVLKLTNREVIQLKSKKSEVFEIIAYNADDKKFHKIGTLPEGH